MYAGCTHRRDQRWFAYRSAYGDAHLRVSDAERHDVIDRLSRHFADGRLDQQEFDQRTERAMRAKTRADLAGLFDDLPELRPARPEPVRRHRHHALLLIALVIIVASTVPSTIASMIGAVHVPWLLIALLVFLWWRSGQRRSR